MSKAHPFQSKALDETLAASPRSSIAATPEAKARHGKLARAGKLASAITLPWRGRQRSTLNGPTPERVGKEDEHLGWKEVEHTGGQVSRQIKTFLESYAEHFTELERRAADKLCKDAEWATRQRVICGRTYTGMVYSGSDDPTAANDDRAFALARFQYVMTRLSPGARGTAFAFIIGTHDEATGKRPMTVERFAMLASNYGAKSEDRAKAIKNTAGPFTVGYIKCLLQWIHALQQDFLKWRDGGLGDERARAVQLERIKADLRSLIKAELEKEFQAELAELERLRLLVPVSRETSGGEA